MSHSSPRPLVVAALLAALFGAPAAAQNLVQNGRFHSDLAGWANLASSTMVHSHVDSRGYPGSGSLEFTNQVAQASTATTAHQCIAVGPGTHEIRVRAAIPAGQARSGFVGFEYFPFAGPSCGGSFLEYGSGPTAGTAGSWLTLQKAVTLPPGTASVRLRLNVGKTQAGGELRAHFDDVYLGKTCTTGVGRLCLDDQRFAVDVRWQTPDGKQSFGIPVPFTGEAGYFWFFAPGNVELVVKEADACAYNQRRWIFISGLTNVKVDIVVTDFETNTVKVYNSPQGHDFVPVLDTGAFATCP
jgi:hypothetical protein